MIASVAVVLGLAGCGGSGTSAGPSSPDAAVGGTRATEATGSTGATGATGVSGATVKVVAAGDISCPPDREPSESRCHQQATSDLALGLAPDAVLTLGDQQYDDGTLEEFERAYTPTWGRLRDITYPAAGNHEYRTQDAAGYYDYFGDVAGPRGKGWYSVDIGAWHVVALNSNCSDVGGCKPGSEQEQWLREDLAAHPARCTLAFWHHPRWSLGKYEDDDDTDALVRALYDAGAELILSGHDHNYQRFAPRNPDGAPDTVRGIRQFVVGSGGRSHYEIRDLSGLESGDDTHFGVLSLTLRPDGYDWRFVPEGASSSGDSGSATCH